MALDESKNIPNVYALFMRCLILPHMAGYDAGNF